MRAAKRRRRSWLWITVTDAKHVQRFKAPPTTPLWKIQEKIYVLNEFDIDRFVLWHPSQPSGSHLSEFNRQQRDSPSEKELAA